MEISGIYDNGPISPVAKIHENLGILTEGAYRYFNINYIEGLPRSRPFIIDMVALNNAANIGAYAQLNAQVVTAISPGGSDKVKEFLHLRWEPLDDVEGFLFELNNQGRYSAAGVFASVTRFSRDQDPFLAATTFFVMGVDKDATIGAYTPLNAQISTAISPGGSDKMKELLHLRWEPLDDVEGSLFELNNQGRFSAAGVFASVTRFSRDLDPFLAATTFFVLGVNKDATIGAYNPNAVALPRARFIFQGYRYLLTPLDAKPAVATELPATSAVY